MNHLMEHGELEMHPLFNTWCETMGNFANSLGADWLIFCEGVAQSPPCTDACFWG